MDRVPVLLLLVALVGGLGASWAHEAHHAHEWSEAQTSHSEDHHTDGDHVTSPCVDGDVHALDCAVCSALGGAVDESDAPTDRLADADRQLAAAEAVADWQRAVAPARGPPVIA